MQKKNFLQADVTPWIGAKVWGSLAVNLGIIEGGIKLTGYLMETQFPSQITIGFAQFPLDIT